MIITIIAAMAENRVIGRDGRLPWHLPEDLARFREITMGQTLIMGRRTYQSIGQPLPGRSSIVLSRQPGFRADGCLVAHDLQSALAMAGAVDEVFICGGEQVYRLALPLADRILLTVVGQTTLGDTFFPEIPDGFTQVSREELPGVPALTFLRYQR